MRSSTIVDVELQNSTSAIATAYRQHLVTERANRKNVTANNETRIKEYLANLEVVKSFTREFYPEQNILINQFEDAKYFNIILHLNQLTPLFKALAEMSVAISTSPQPDLFRPILINAINLLNGFTNLIPENDLSEYHEILNQKRYAQRMSCLTINIQAATEFVKHPTIPAIREKLLEKTTNTLQAYDRDYYIHQNRSLYGFASAVSFVLGITFCYSAFLMIPVTSLPALITCLTLWITSPIAVSLGIWGLVPSLSPIKDYQQPAYTLSDTVKQVCKLGIFNSQQRTQSTLEGDSDLTRRNDTTTSPTLITPR
jgi:hypothetical protein